MPPKEIQVLVAVMAGLMVVAAMVSVVVVAASREAEVVERPPKRPVPPRVLPLVVVVVGALGASQHPRTTGPPNSTRLVGREEV